MMNHKQHALSDFPFQHTLNTRWRDLDAFGHINNAAFLTYFEDARIMIMQKWQLDHHDKSLIVAGLHIDYFQQLQHPTSLSIGMKISRLGNTSFDILACLYADKTSQPAAACTVTAVCFDYVNQKPIKILPQILADAEQSG